MAFPAATRDARREFFTTSAAGLGGLALTSMLAEEQLLSAESTTTDKNRLDVRPPHFAPRAKRCILIFLAGAPSHVDLYDPKPVLQQRHGQQPPKSLTDTVRFAFIKKDSAILMGSPRKFPQRGESAMPWCDLMPKLGSCVDDIALIRSPLIYCLNRQ